MNNNDLIKEHSIYSIEDIKRKHRGHWFSKGAMSFFNSRVGDKIKAGKILFYFVSSEKFDYKTPRYYSIRSYNALTDTIETVGEFQGYSSNASAWNAVERLIKKELKQ